MKEIIITLFTIAFIAVPFILVLCHYKEQDDINKLYTQLKNDDTQDQNKENEPKVDSFTLKRSIVNIAVYAGIFFVLASIISMIFLYGYMLIKEIPFDILTNLEENSAIYNQIINDVNPLLQFSIYLIAIAVVVPLSYRWIVKDLCNVKGKYIAFGAMGFGLLYAANIVANILMIILGMEGDSANQEAIINMMQPGLPTILMFFATVIFAPILEELIFRKSIFNLFPNKPYLALVISSIGFGLLHVVSSAFAIIPEMISGNATYLEFISELFYVIPYGLMGFALGFSYIKSEKNIVAPIFAHALNNLLSFVMIIWL